MFTFLSVFFLRFYFFKCLRDVLVFEIFKRCFFKCLREMFCVCFGFSKCLRCFSFCECLRVV